MKMLTASLIALVLSAGAYVNATQETETVRYQIEMDYGDTLWGIVGKVATDEDDFMELVSKTRVLNGIADCGDLQPGTVITIEVERRK